MFVIDIINVINKTGKKNNSPAEMDLYPMWQSFCKSKRKTVCGRLQGEFAGEINLSEGPDFSGAVFFLDGTKSSGDVEIHIRRRDWYKHGHHLDSRYDRVMLHLVWSESPDDLKPVHNSKGCLIPAISVQALPPQLVMQNRVADCVAENTNRTGLMERFMPLITQRLVGVGRQIYRKAADSSLDQALFCEICAILGSPQNSKNFRWLANHLHWEILQLYRQRFNLSSCDYYAILLNISGLLSTKRSHRALKPRLIKLGFMLPPRHLNRQMWKLSGQRPSHNPLIRLAGLALFISSFRSTSIHEQFYALFSQRLVYKDLRKRFKELCQPVEIPSELAKVILHNPNYSLWGEDLLTEIIGNVVIPFFYLRVKENPNSGFYDYLYSIYQSLTLTSSYAINRIFLNWPEVDTLLFRRFYVQQALLQLRQYFCQEGRCIHCPLGRKAIRH
jgi:hypothetical protein